MRNNAAVAACAVVVTALTGACADSEASSPEQESVRYCSAFDAYELHGCRPQHRLPDGPLGDQLAWVFEQLGGGAASLTVEQVRSHLAPELQEVQPPEQLLEAFRTALADVGPATFVGFAYPPRADQAMALGDAESGQRIAVALGVSGGLIDRSEEHTSELQSRQYLVCRLLLDKKILNQTHSHQAPSNTPFSVIL